MIFANFFLFLIAFFFVSASLSGQGKVINYRNNFNFFENIFFGFIFFSFDKYFFTFFYQN